MCDDILIFFLFEWHLICSTHYATTSLISQQFSSIKILTLQSMGKDTIYQSCMFHVQVVVKNRILSNHNKLIYIFYNTAITNFKLVMPSIRFPTPENMGKDTLFVKFGCSITKLC